MNYKPNTILWSVGSLVLHDADAKEPKMLMRVTSYCKKTSEFRTRYVHPSAPKEWKKTLWRNSIGSLHDPARFGLKVSNAPHERAAEGGPLDAVVVPHGED